MSDSIIEIKGLIEQIAKARDEEKKANEELLKAKADGKAVSDLEAKLANVSGHVDKLLEMKDEIEQVMTKLQRPGAGQSDEKMADEVKSFNLNMRAHYQGLGKPAPQEMDADGYKSYKSAFFKVVSGAKVDDLEVNERKALQAGSDPDGGYLLPPSTVGRMVSKIYEQSTMRQICDVQTISTNKIEGIVDNDETDAGWVSELGARTSNDGTPQVGKWSIEAFEMYALPKASQRIIDDAATDIEAWLASKTADKFARVEGTGFCTGNGVGKPHGLFAYATAATGDETRAWGTFEHVVTGASADFHTTKADPLQDLIGAFKDQYLANASWLMRREVRTKIRKLKEATSDRYLWEPSLQAGQPDRLLGYPVRVDQYVPAIAANSLSLAFGDFRQAYTIVDRLGIRTLRDPYTAKPYVVFYSTKRTGGGAVNFEAVKFLKFGT